MTDSTETTDTTDPIAEIGITVTDMASILQVIDYCAEEGAFRGWHMIRQVLPLRDKLEAFVTAVTGQLNTPESELSKADPNETA